MNDDETSTRTAYHEAGHAIVALLVGAEVLLMTIEPDRDDGPERHGEVKIGWDARDFSPRELREWQLQVALAGPVAEMVYRGEPLHPLHVPEWQLDWNTAWDLAATFHEAFDKRMRFLETQIRRLHQQLQQDDAWQALASLADALLAHETLETEEIVDAVAPWLADLFPESDW